MRAYLVSTGFIEFKARTSQLTERKRETVPACHLADYLTGTCTVYASRIICSNVKVCLHALRRTRFRVQVEIFLHLGSTWRTTISHGKHPVMLYADGRCV